MFRCQGTTLVRFGKRSGGAAARQLNESNANDFGQPAATSSNVNKTKNKKKAKKNSGALTSPDTLVTQWNTSTLSPMIKSNEDSMC